MIIGIAGSGVRSGKSTVAAVLAQELQAEIVPLAAPLKSMLDALFRQCGIERQRRLDYLYGKAKGEIIPELGITPRRAMQTLGTEWGRDCLGQNFWLTVWALRANEHLIVNDQAVVIADDVRFPNEAEYLKSMGGTIIKVIGQDSEEGASDHASEGQPIVADRVIFNYGTLEELQNVVRSIAKEL